MCVCVCVCVERRSRGKGGGGGSSKLVVKPSGRPRPGGRPAGPGRPNCLQPNPTAAAGSSWTFTFADWKLGRRRWHLRQKRRWRRHQWSSSLKNDCPKVGFLDERGAWVPSDLTVFSTSVTNSGLKGRRGDGMSSLYSRFARAGRTGSLA